MNWSQVGCNDNIKISPEMFSVDIYWSILSNEYVNLEYVIIYYMTYL